MANETKACNLTEEEIYTLLRNHGNYLTGVYSGTDVNSHIESTIERINYLNKRLKAFKEPEPETKPAVAAGWGTPTT